MNEAWSLWARAGRASATLPQKMRALTCASSCTCSPGLRDRLTLGSRSGTPTPIASFSIRPRRRRPRLIRRRRLYCRRLRRHHRRQAAHHHSRLMKSSNASGRCPNATGQSSASGIRSASSRCARCTASPVSLSASSSAAVRPSVSACSTGRSQRFPQSEEACVTCTGYSRSIGASSVAHPMARRTPHSRPTALTSSANLSCLWSSGRMRSGTCGHRRHRRRCRRHHDRLCHLRRHCHHRPCTRLAPLPRLAHRSQGCTR